MARVFQVKPLLRSPFSLVLGFILVSIALAAPSHAEEKTKRDQAEKLKPAKLKISGYGLTRNWELRRMLKTLELGGKKPEFFDAAFVEDAALLISARVRRDGYLVPDVFIDLRLDNGGEIRVHASDLLENPLPRPLRVIEARFTIRKGVLYHYKTVRFEGLETVAENEALSYFVETGALFHFKPHRIYTPEKLRSGIASLTDVLERQGFENARAEVSEMVRDDKSGAVSVTIKVQQGKKSVVGSVREEFFYGSAAEPKDVRTVFPNKPYSRVWLQDFTQSLKTNQFHRGYPDTTVEVKTSQRQEQSNLVHIAIQAKIQSGSQITIGEITFKGEKHTQPSLMARRVRVQRGELLDRIRTEEGRYRLAQLGAFSTVDLDYQPIDEHSREVIYTVREGKRTDVNLLFG